MMTCPHMLLHEKREARILALRLAVEARQPDLREQFYEFLTSDLNQTPPALTGTGLAKAVSDAVDQIKQDQARHSFGDES